MTRTRTINARFAEMHESVAEIHEHDSAGRYKQVYSQRRLVLGEVRQAEEVIVGPKPTNRSQGPERSSVLEPSD